MNFFHSQPIFQRNHEAVSDFATPPVDYRDTWRVFRIMAEFVEGLQFLSTLKNEVTIMGSARLKPSDPYYKIAKKLGFYLGKNGFTTITGGGPGIMEATNHGAYLANGESVGLNIQLPFEQRINPYVKKSAAFYYFFTRKVMLTSPANAFVFFPGGYGTLDEFFEVVNMISLEIMKPVPIVLVGKKFWQPLLDFLQDYCGDLGAIKKETYQQWHLVETAEEAFNFISKTKDQKPLNYLGLHGKPGLDWKVFKIMAEFVEGLEFITGLRNGITVLGSKSVTRENPYFAAALELGAHIAEQKKPLVTGGRYGIAEAANQGAYTRQGLSVGIGLKNKKQFEVNPYTNKTILFEYPFVRQLVVTSPTQAFVFFPGGLGTLHQLYEVLTLIQTRKISRRPVILFDHRYWGKLHEFNKIVLAHEEKAIADADDEIYQIVDSVESIMKIINTN